jgi:hypothetical protein
MLKASKGSTWSRGAIRAFRALSMLFTFALRNRTSGPKGRKADNVEAGDKSPAYAER